MLYKSKAIILHTVPYKESSIIAYAYSLENGRISLLINAVRKKKSKIKFNVFQPLTIVEVIYYFNRRFDLLRVKDIKPLFLFTSIPYRIDKNSVAIFISEIIYKTIKEEVKNEPLFTFLISSIQFLDKLDKNISIFNLLFLTQLTRHLGIMPQNNFSPVNLYFNIRDGHFNSLKKESLECIDETTSRNLHFVLKCPYWKTGNIKIPKIERKQLMHLILQYYQIHLDHKIDIKSLKVLEEVFSN